jgi:hypothetical protein
MENKNKDDTIRNPEKDERRVRFEYENDCNGLRPLNQCSDPNQGVRSRRPGFFGRRP